MTWRFLRLFILVSIFLTGISVSFIDGEEFEIKGIESMDAPLFSAYDCSDDIRYQGTICELKRDDGQLDDWIAYFDPGDMIAIYLDPADCGVSPGEIFQLKAARFTLFSQFGGGFPSADWPLLVTIEVWDYYDPWYGPSYPIWSQFALVDSIDAEYPNWYSVDIAGGHYAPLILYRPFFLVFRYDSTNSTPMPSVVIDSQSVPAYLCWVAESPYYYWQDWSYHWEGSYGYPLLRAIIDVFPESEVTTEVWPDTNTLCVRGTSADYYVILTSMEEFGYPCSLFASGLPSGVTGNFYPPVVFPPDTSILLLNAFGPISGDTYVFTIFAQWVFYGDTLMDSTQACLIVSNPPLFVPVVDPVVFFAEESNTLWVEASDPDSTDTLRITPSQGEWDFTQTDSLTGHASGFLSWTPFPDDTLNSPYQVVFFVQDNYLCEGIDSCRIFVVYDVNHPPVIWLEPSFSETTIYEGDTLSFYVVVQDPDLDSVFAWMDMIPRPAIFEFYRHLEEENRWEWVVTFTPDYTQASTYEMTFFASDTAGLADTAQVTIEVLNFNRRPSIQLPFTETTIYERDSLEFSVSGRDPDGDPLSCYAYNLPEGAHFDTIECIFSWIPEWGQLNEYLPLFVISDGEFADSAVVKITVRNRPLGVKEHYPYFHEEDVLIDSYIHVTLSEPIKFQTVDSSTFVVESRKDGIVRGVLIYTENNRLLGFSLPPGSMFSTLDTITVTLTTGIKDLVDSGMAEDYSWEFYTGIGVYPGNTNDDNMVDERDILPLGFYWGETGPARKEENQGTVWSIKPVHRWDPVSATYADADGNGIVDEWDICGVSDNWDSTVSSSVYKLQERIDFAEEVSPEHLSIYEKIYNALLDCPESEGKNKIKKLLEGILEEKDIPSKFGLSQNYPNPFNLTTVISYSLPEDCQVEISIFNVLGQKVRTLVNEYQSAGYRKVIWDGKDNYGQEVGSGIYFYKVNAKDYSCTRKLLFLK